MLTSELFYKFFLIEFNALFTSFCILTEQVSASSVNLDVNQTVSLTSNNINFEKDIRSPHKSNLFNYMMPSVIESKQLISTLNSSMDASSTTKATLLHTTLNSIIVGDYNLQGIESTKTKGWRCHCWNSTNEFENELECRCEGESLIRIPQKLYKGMNRLTITEAGLEILRSTGLKAYATSLRDIVITDLDNFQLIQPEVFEGIKNLRTIYISHAPKLTYLSKDVFLGISNTIKTIRIIYCGLVKIPDMRYLSTGTILHMIDLEGNQIVRIERKSVRIKTEQLILDNNSIRMIDESAFHGSEIAKLSLKSNSLLQEIHPSAFLGVISIQELDLSSTSLSTLPSIGLQGLEVLRIQNTHSLKTIPSIYNFKKLEVAWLTHSFHCCAFKFPSRHDPTLHAQRLQYLETLQRYCMNNKHTPPVDDDNIQNMMTHSPLLPEFEFMNQIRQKRYPEQTHSGKFSDSIKNQQKSDVKMDNFSENILAITGSSIVVLNNNEKEIEGELLKNQDMGEFHETTADVTQNSQWDALCGNLTQRKIEVSCFPMPNALNPCEDVMGSHWLRISVWVVVFLAVLGNIAVLVVILSNRTDVSVQKFLMSHLAFADLCMGLYLLLIASIDSHSMGEYFNYAFDWQYGAGCKIAGFLTVFASHLSVFTLTIITIERWFAITHAIHLNRRIKIKSATFIMIGGWIYSGLMSTLPLFGISNYSSTSICLPMEVRDSSDVAYLVSIIGINGAAFFGIAICYTQIYFSLGKETRSAPRSSTRELSIAKKMALLVFTNFACWAPIAFFGLTALAGYPLINVTKSKILLVFFYPLNSCADPYLYAILTSQYRQDMYILLSKFGLFKNKAEQFRRANSIVASNQVFQTTRTSLSGQDSLRQTQQETVQMLNEDFV